MTKKIINLASNWTERFQPKNTNQNNTKEKERIVWATSFPKLLELTEKEKSLKPRATTVYKKPATLANKLTNYRQLAHDKHSDKQGSSNPCGSCSLCGTFGRHASMVSTTHQISLKNGKQIHLAQDLTCKNYGIYIATCLECRELYVGQTLNQFSKRWTAHRFDWKNTEDRSALVQHFQTRHPKIMQRKPELESCFTVAFVEEPPVHMLDVAENKWLIRTSASINNHKMILPTVR